MKLHTRKYTYAELQAFKNNTSKHKSIDYLLNNVQALRLLGWTLTFGRNIPKDKLNGYEDVVKFSTTLKRNKVIISK